MALWGPKPFLDAEDEAWQLELWRWFLDKLGREVDFRTTPLVLPTRAFFPPAATTGAARAEHIFGCVKKLARMDDWPCRLEAQPEQAPLLVNEYTALKPIKQGPGGTFGYDGDEVMITYDPGAVDDPGKLVAILAHELAHYLIGSWWQEIPGGPDLYEPATDLATVYLGFGVFGAAAAFQFEADMTGWRWSRGGYLSPRTWTFALALFLELRGEKADVVKPYLKSHLYSDLTEAGRSIRKRGLAEPLQGAISPPA